MKPVFLYWQSLAVIITYFYPSDKPCRDASRNIWIMFPICPGAPLSDLGLVKASDNGFVCILQCYLLAGRE